MLERRHYVALSAAIRRMQFDKALTRRKFIHDVCTMLEEENPESFDMPRFIAACE